VRATGALRAGFFAGLYLGGRALERAAKLAYYTAAGTMRLEDLRRAIAREWEDAGARESERYVSSFGLTDWEQELYPRFLRREDRILVVGCGTGRDLVALLQRGYRADGLDLSSGCTATARDVLAKRGLEADVLTGDIATVTLPRRFDAFVFSAFCYSLIPHADARIAALRRVTEHLTPGGRILISYIPCDPLPSRIPIRLTQAVARLSGSDWRPEYGDILFLASRGKRIDHFEHRFPPGEFEREARAADAALLFHDPGDATAVLVAGESSAPGPALAP
jgi:SAM-dependent methyltransferase